MPVVCLCHEACSFFNKWKLLKSTTTDKKAEKFLCSMSSSIFFLSLFEGFFTQGLCPIWSFARHKGTSNGLFIHCKQTQCSNGCHVINFSRLLLARYLCLFHRVFSLSALLASHSGEKKKFVS